MNSLIFPSHFCIINLCHLCILEPTLVSHSCLLRFSLLRSETTAAWKRNWFNLSRFLWKTWTWGRWRKKQSCFVVFSSEFLLSFLLSSRQRSRPRYHPPSRRWIPTEKIINIWGDFLNAVKSEFYRVRSVAEVPFLDMLLDWNVALYSSELSLLLEPFHLKRICESLSLTNKKKRQKHNHPDKQKEIEEKNHLGFLCQRLWSLWAAARWAFAHAGHKKKTH